MTFKNLYILILLCCGTFSVAQYPALKPLLDAQRNNAVIDIPKGKYLMDTQNGGGYNFSNLTNVSINLNGSEIICNKASNVFTFTNCTNVTVKGFSVDYDPLLFTQGIITAVDASRRWFEFVVDEGYPITNIIASRTQFFDATTRELKRNSFTTYDGSFTLSAVTGAPRKFRATKPYVWNANETVGDYVVMSCSGSGHAFYMYKCNDMVIEDVTFYGAASFTFFENETNNSHYLNCKVTKKINELERPSPRLRSSNMDGIHSKNARKGPTIENCEVKYGGDDCIAINGAMYPIIAVDRANRTVTLLSTSTSSYLQIADTMQFVSFSGKKVGISIMEAGRAVTATTAEIAAFLAKYPDLKRKENYNNGIQIRVDEVPAGLAVGDVIYSRDKIGSGFVIKNNDVGHIRSRAILIKASDGIITGNTISNCEMGGIVISPEYDWMEAGFSSNLEISHNTISNCMFGRSSTGGKAGALSVMCVGGSKSIAPVGAYNNISIHNNTIADCPRPSVVVTSVDGLSYFSNTITPDLSTVRTHGQNFGVPNNVDYWTRNVTMHPNTGIDNADVDKLNIYISNNQLHGIERFMGSKLKIFSIDGILLKSLVVDNTNPNIDLKQNRDSICIVTVEVQGIVQAQKLIVRN
ncbi:MAG: right-handed parallel beta-helix repeat-containing protein [Paludibacter sp.]|nr:right-handed parallel beta-helix repeat-containing protein [Paludibacter sp.]